jgi:hypothetical protein
LLGQCPRLYCPDTIASDQECGACKPRAAKVVAYLIRNEDATSDDARPKRTRPLQQIIPRLGCLARAARYSLESLPLSRVSVCGQNLKY